MRGGAEIIMKKLLPILFCLTILPSFAITITVDTQLKWNSKVIESAALECRLGSSLTFGDAYYGILDDLLERDTFSCNDAARVCKSKCSEENFDDSFCKDLCIKFVYALVNTSRLRKNAGNNPCFGNSEKGHCVSFGFGYESQIINNIGLSDILEFDKEYNKRNCNIGASFIDICPYGLSDNKKCTYIPCTDNIGNIVIMYNIPQNTEDDDDRIIQNFCGIGGGSVRVPYTGWADRCRGVSETYCNTLQRKFGNRIEIEYQNNGECRIGKDADILYGGEMHSDGNGNGKVIYYKRNETTGEYERILSDL